MKRRPPVFVWLVAVSCVSAILVRVASSSRAIAPQDTNDSSDAWARENYDRALDLLLQDRCTSATDARWLACIRIVPGYSNELEYSLSVEKRYGGPVFARIVRPTGDSIRTQLRERKNDHLKASVGDVAKLIKIESRAVDQRGFPGLVPLADEFEKIRISPSLSDEIIMDATQYRFRIRSFPGESMELTVSGPGPTAPHQPNPLIQWAESTKHVLVKAFE